MNTEQQGEEAFRLHNLIAENETKRRRLLGVNVELLRKMKNEELYKTVLGDNDAEWVAYLGLVETFYSRNTIYNLTRIYDKFCIELGLMYQSIAGVPTSRLIEMLPVVTKENCDELLAKGLTLTSRDFTDEIREMKGLPTTNTCTHDYKEYEICKSCGERHELSKKYNEKN